jgi:uncharacterized surface protein with fasciclin (FAS1) repeats
MKSLNYTLLAGLSALALSACSGSETADTTATDTTVVADETANTDTMAPAGTEQNIVEMAQGNSDVSTLVSAVTAAGLAETLSGTGPFTVFAPTNEAFAKVNKEALGDLMQPANKAKLADLLKYHVVSGNVKSTDLAKMIKDGGGTATVTTMGGSLKASMDGEKIVLTDGAGNKSTVTGADMTATNGVAHTIDSVLMK